MSANGTLRAADMLKRYLRLSESFILDENAVMDGIGSRLVLFSLPQRQPPPHHPIVKTVKAPLYHLPAALQTKIKVLAQAHGACALRAALRYTHALLRAVYSSLQSMNPLGVSEQFGFVADECPREVVTLIHAQSPDGAKRVAAYLAQRVAAHHAREILITTEVA